MDFLPLSFAQRALWLLDRLHPGSSLYNVPFAVRLRGNVDISALRRALSRVTERHEVLRTVFPSHNWEPYQQVMADPTVPLATVDLRGHRPDVREDEARKTIRAWADAPFDLAGDRLFRAGLVRVADEEYLLGLFLHHIVCDGPSMHILFEEIGAYYSPDQEDSDSQGHGELPPLKVQFADYAVRQREAGADPSGISWWQEYLAGAPTTLALPTDHPRPSRRSGRGTTHTVRLPGSLVAASASLARSERATPFMVMMAAYAALLGRLTGARELLVGTPVAGRSEEEYEPLIGFFVNTVPLRIDLSGEPGLGELVRRVRAATLDAVAHSDVPFEALVRHLSVDRDPATVPLVQAMLTFEPTPLAEPRFSGLESRLLPVFADAAKFDLDVMIVRAPDDSGDFDLSITYSTDLFEPDTIAAFAQRFEGLLAAGTADPALPLHQLPVLTAQEARAAVERWNPVVRPRDPDALVPVHAWVSRWAAAKPQGAAVSSEAGTLSYAELDRRAGRLAHRLRLAGAGSGDVVGILLPRGADLVTAMLAVLKSGAAYLPLDLTHPVSHLRRILRAAGARHVLTDDENAPRLDGVNVKPVQVRSPGAPLPDGPAPNARPHPDDLAYVLFTSGSTGEPKGVGVPHGALSNHALAIWDAFALTGDDRVLQFANAAFDVAAEELFPTWAAGACVALCEQPPAPEQLTRQLDAQDVTVANLPASYWQRWDAAIERGDSAAPRCLRLLVVGSEPVDPSTLRAWRGRSAVPVINAYGLTETTITALTHEVDGRDEGPLVPVGTPIAGVRAYVLDAHLEHTPVGVPGELYIGGAGLARGYLGRPDLTADRFVPDPFAPAPGGRMHRTGDLARRRRDGAIELLGRIDEQLKVRGYRIEPAEVEAALCAHPDVVQAAVTARTGTDGTDRLVAHVVTGCGALPDDLRAHLTARLPAHLVPGSLTCLPSLPLLPSGKVNRAALPEPALPAAPTASDSVPGTDLERSLAGIWREALALDRVGLHDNFFDLGGTSFTLAAVHARLREHLDRRLPMVALYEHPTIAALASYLTGPGEDTRGAAAGANGQGAAAADAARLRAGRARLRQRRLHKN